MVEEKTKKEASKREYEVTITYGFIVKAKDEQEAEERAYELMEDQQPKVEVEEISDEDD